MDFSPTWVLYCFVVVFIGHYNCEDIFVYLDVYVRRRTLFCKSFKHNETSLAMISYYFVIIVLVHFILKIMLYFFV